MLDEIAATGLRLDRFYAAHPSCSPTRDFLNYRHPALTEADYLGPRSIVEGRFKLVIHGQKNGAPKRELFDLEADPAERTNLLEQQPARAEQLFTKLRAWQDSVLKSLTGADYSK